MSMKAAALTFCPGSAGSIRWPVSEPAPGGTSVDRVPSNLTNLSSSKTQMKARLTVGGVEHEREAVDVF